MKNFIYIIIITLLTLSCKSEINTDDTLEIADFNLFLKTNQDIDSVHIMDIGQQRENYKIPYRDTIKLNFKDSINDLYAIHFLKGEESISVSQLWLKGENIIIKGQIDKKLIIDTIINSNLNYSSKEINRDLRHLFKVKSKDSIIDRYYYNRIKENIENPLSLPLAEAYIRRNKNNIFDLNKLDNLLKEQSYLLKNHSFFQPHNKLKKTLSVTNLDFEKYKFYNLKNELSTIQLNKNKKYIIDFWFVNCHPCVKEHKYIASKESWLKAKDIRIIGISKDDDHVLFEKYLLQNHYNWKNYREVDSLKLIREELEIIAFPTYLVIEDGTKIEKTFNSFEKVVKYLSN